MQRALFLPATLFCLCASAVSTAEAPPGPDVSNTSGATAAPKGPQVETLLRAWQPFFLEVGGANEDLSGELRALAEQASAEQLDTALGLQTYPAVLAALRGEPVSDEAVIDRLARDAVSQGLTADQVKLFGDADRDLLFVPIPPCRIVDTRVAGGQISAGATRNIDVTAVSDYSFQGGASGNCSGAGAAGSFAAGVFTISVPGAAASGALTAYALGATQPLVRTLEFSLGEPASTTTTVQLDQGASSNEMTIATTATTHVVIDMVGYFINPGPLVFECQETNQTVLSVAAGSTANATAPACPAGYIQTSTNCQSSTWQMPFVYFTGGTCSAQNNSSGTASLRASRTCCRARRT